MNYWLMKSEPDTFSLEHLKKMPKMTSPWDGVRNYQARNFMRDEMRKGDLILFYHSSCPVPGCAGVAQVVRESYPDPSAFDKNSPYYDPKSSMDAPRWMMVDIQYKSSFNQVISLKRMREEPKLAQMKILQKGCRLSITPITKSEFDYICSMDQA